MERVMAGAIVLLIALITLHRAVRIVPRHRIDLVQRLGRYRRKLSPGVNLVVPFVDAVSAKVDMREQVLKVPATPLLTSDNRLVSVDTVLHIKVVDPVRATYETNNFRRAVEHLALTRLRDVVGSLDLERALTGRELFRSQLVAALDRTTDTCGVKVDRVEIGAIQPVQA